MRFTRAAKVAAFPLLALVLVVALVACQGPIGPKGDKGDSVTGDEGETGTAAPPGLDAAAIPVEIFGPIDNTGVEDGADAVQMVDVSAGFTGGTAEGRKYRVVSTINLFAGLTHSLNGDTGMLTLTVAQGTDAPAADIDDALILVQAIDADTDKSSEVAHVRVRLNAVPVVGDNTQDITFSVGTQSGDTADGDEDDNPDDYRSDSPIIKCVTLNACSVTPPASDFNRQDTLTWDFYWDSDKVLVEATADGSGVTVTGKESTGATPVNVWIWAVDDLARAEGPVLLEEDSDGTDHDETKVPAGARQLIVTVDGALRTNNTVESLTMDIDDTEVVGKIIDPESMAIGSMGFEVTGHDSDIATLTLAMELMEGRQVMTVESHNSGTTTFTVKVTETENER